MAIMKSEKQGEVRKTYEYSSFKLMDANRKINSRNYAKLVASMDEEQLIIPIIVNEKMEIIDGQHRFTAEKELGLPVYYIIQKGYGIDQVKRANMVGTNWTKEDFLESHVQDGSAGYAAFKDLVDLYDVNISDLIKVFASVQHKNQTISAKQFEEGSFSMDKKEDVIEFLEALEDFKGFKEYKTKPFFTAFMKLYFQPDYDHGKMKDRLKTRASYLTKKSTYGEYLELLTKLIYSFGAVKNPLFYDMGTGKFYKG
jgi:hypothetical protein